jgi:hypothetical protein
MNEYHEFKERFNSLQANQFSKKPDERVDLLTDLAEDMLSTLEALAHFAYLTERRVPYEISSFYPRITKDPTIDWYDKFDGMGEGSQVLENPDFVKLHELGLYALSSDSGYFIRSEEQIKYLSQFLNFDLDNFTYYINFD